MADTEKKQEPNSRRRFLIAATSIAGGIASIGVATPFVMSMMPSERAKAAGAPVEVDISKLEPGMLLLVEWRGKVVWVLDRTPEMLANLKKLDSQMADPKSEKPQQPAYAQERYAFDQTGNFWWSRASAPTWDVRLYIARISLPRIWALIGWAVSSVPATAPSSTLRDASTSTFRPRPTWSFRPTCT